jgi:PAS domain S-box-containing protein
MSKKPPAVEPDLELERLRSRVADLEARDATLRDSAAQLRGQVAALTAPLGSDGATRFQDLVDLEEIQALQDAFAEATGVASIITDVNGVPITRPSGFCRLCLHIIRATPRGLANCIVSDAALGRRADGPTLRPCLSGGLLDGGASICVGDHHVANWLIGQVIDEGCDPQRLLDYADEIGADREEFRAALAEVTRMPRERFESVSRALYLFAGAISRLAHHNHQQARHIAERQRSEAVLREREEELRKLNDQLEGITRNAPDSIFVLDEQGRITFANPEAERVFGFALHELKGEVLHHLIHHHHPDGRPYPKAECSVEGVLRRGETVRGIEDVYFRKDGSNVHVSCSNAPLAAVDGRRSGAVLIVRDTSDLKTMQAQLMQADRMASVGMLAAGVAHEINNPLAYLMAALDFLDRELMGVEGRPPRLDEVREALAEAREGAGRVRHVVRDLKTFSRVEEERRTRVELRSVIESSINMVLNEVKYRARLVREYGQTPPVLANEARLGQVFLNLLINAAQAVPEGHAEENEIRVITSTDELGRAIVEVCDTGPGVPSDVADRIFDPFFTTKPLGVGTGLGLSICRNIVTALGGEIAVACPLNGGTVFRVVLPPAPPAAGEAAPQKTAAGKQGGRGRVLVVDDEPAVGAAIRRVLASEHTVTVLTSALEARERIARGDRFDVILCDLMMPEMTGMDLHAELAALAPDQAERMVLLTGGAFTSKASQFLRAVPNTRVEKPFDSADLRALVRGLVG